MTRESYAVIELVAIRESTWIVQVEDVCIRHILFATMSPIPNTQLWILYTVPSLEIAIEILVNWMQLNRVPNDVRAFGAELRASRSTPVSSHTAYHSS